MDKQLYESKLQLDERYVCCPICGHECTHLGDVRIDTNIACGNQGNVSIVFNGECGHQWILIFSGHKGNVSYGTAVIKETLQLMEKE